MKTRTSKQSKIIKSLLVLPVLAVLLFGFSETKFVERANSTIEKNINEELEKVDQIQVNFLQSKGATKKMMLEYEQFITEYENTNSVLYSVYQRAIAIYGLMTDEQKKSVKKYPEFPTLDDLKVTEVKPLKQSKFEAYKNKENYAVWLDNKVIDLSLIHISEPTRPY